MNAMLLLVLSSALFAQRLHPGQSIDAEISTGHSRIFTVPLKAGHFARIVVTQPRLPAVLRLLDVNGNPSVELHLPGTTHRPEPLVWIAGRDGEYRVELTTAASAPRGRDKCRVKLDQPRPSVPADQQSVDAQEAYRAGRVAEANRDFDHAIEEWERSLALYRTVGDRERQATVLSAMGFANSAA